jgi:hypothetical protein
MSWETMLRYHGLLRWRGRAMADITDIIIVIVVVAISLVFEIFRTFQFMRTAVLYAQLVFR